MYVMDYGAPVGFRIFAEHPERVQAFIIQNGNAYEEGLETFWDDWKAWWDDKTPENEMKLHYLLHQTQQNGSTLLECVIQIQLIHPPGLLM